jgi:hypothetical protein
MDPYEEWARFANEAGGELIVERSGLARMPRVRIPIERWTLASDFQELGTSHNQPPYTLFALAYVPQDEFAFTIDPVGRFSRMNPFHRAGVAIEPAFDERMVVRSPEPERVQQLLAAAEMRHALLDAPRGRLQSTRSRRIRISGSGWVYALNNVPEEFALLHFAVPQAVERAEALHAVHALFRESLQRMRALNLIADVPLVDAPLP